jgi:hypothetical protein
MDVDYKNYK